MFDRYMFFGSLNDTFSVSEVQLDSYYVYGPRRTPRAKPGPTVDQHPRLTRTNFRPPEDTATSGRDGSRAEWIGFVCFRKPSNLYGKKHRGALKNNKKNRGSGSFVIRRLFFGDGSEKKIIVLKLRPQSG